MQGAMAKEVREVEAIIEKVVDETRIDSTLHVPGGHSYFETMVPVSSPGFILAFEMEGGADEMSTGSRSWTFQCRTKGSIRSSS